MGCQSIHRPIINPTYEWWSTELNPNPNFPVAILSLVFMLSPNFLKESKSFSLNTASKALVLGVPQILNQQGLPFHAKSCQSNKTNMLHESWIEGIIFFAPASSAFWSNSFRVLTPRGYISNKPCRWEVNVSSWE